MPLTSTVAITVNANYSKLDGNVNANAQLLKDYTKTLQTGVGAGQADLFYQKTRTLGPSATEDLDLAGVLLDNYGVALTFARIKYLIIAAADANVNNVLIGGVTNGLSTFLQPAATGINPVRPGGFVAYGCGVGDATGYVVTAATADLLHVANSAGGTSVTYDVIIGGCSA